MRRKKIVSSDSEEEEESNSADSDSTVVNSKVTNKRKPSNQKTTNRLAASRSRSLTSSSRNVSPQPGPSGLCNNHDSDNNSSEYESADSDYVPVMDTSHGKKRKLTTRADRAKKQRAQRSVNGVSSIKRTEPTKSSQPNTKGKVSSTKRTEPTKSSQPNAKRKQSIPNGFQFNAKDVESLAQKLVYFLLAEDQKKYAIKRKNIKSSVFKDETYSPKLYVAVLDKANYILQKVYGMELLEVQDQKDSYLIVNKLDKELGIHDYVEMSKLKQQQRGLILYLITVIFMNENVITEDELTKCLKPLDIDLTSKKLHPIFGDVKKYITNELVKQMYLSYELISKDPEKYEIKWGVRAIQEFDKREILQFACQITGHRPEDWRVQYKDAEEGAIPQPNGNS